MAVINPSIALAAIPQRNMLESFHQGQMMRQEKQAGDLALKGQKNALASQAAQMLARGVLSSDNPQAAYPKARQIAQRMGMDVSALPDAWGPESEMMIRMFAMPEGERTDFMRAMELIPPDQRQQAAMVRLGLAPKAGADSALDRKVDALIESGVDRETALGIATGRLVTSRDPVTGTAQIIDKASGQVLGNAPAAAAAPSGPRVPAAPPPAGGPLAGLDEAPAAPAGPPAQRQAQPQAGFGVEGEIEQEGVDFPSAFGAEGIMKNVANIAADFVGAGQVYPDAATAKRQIENLNTQTATLLAEGTETRGGKYLIDRFDAIQAQAGGIQGPEDALKTLAEIRGLLQRAYEINASIAQSEVSPTEKSQAIATLRRLEPMIGEYGQIIDTFQRQYYGPQQGPAAQGRGTGPAAQTAPQAGQEAPPPPEGVDPQLWQFMTPEERSLWQN